MAGEPEESGWCATCKHAKSWHSQYNHGTPRRLCRGENMITPSDPVWSPFNGYVGNHCPCEKYIDDGWEGYR